MTRLRTIFAAAVFSFITLALRAEDGGWDFESLSPGESGVTVDLRTGTMTGTNGVLVKYNGSVLTADRVTANQKTGDATADGAVRIQQGDQVWAGEHIYYNFKTREMVSEQFRSGKPPVFMEGSGLHGDNSNRVYVATNALITADDYEQPAIKIRARRIKITPGDRVQAWDAVLYLGAVPVFYFPYYVRDLGPNAGNFNITPGYRSAFGAFALGTYTWYLNDYLDGQLHMDYRQTRGAGGGPDFNYHLGRWGDGQLRYYYTHDDEPTTNHINSPVYEHRQRVYFTYLASPYTNLEVRSMVRYESDAGIVRDFFTSEYRENPQPNTFVEANKFWNNFSLDVLTQPRVNNFYETVERLPDVRLSGFRQQIGDSPLYYESESSVGYYRRLFAETNGAVGDTNYYASRADTYHQITLPETYFGWLNFTPRAGGRFTYYSQAEGPGAVTDEQTRGVFNTGAEVNFKASRTWPGIENKFLDMDGLRHIVEPSVNYVYVPRPNVRPDQLPQFDYELPSLRMLPIEYPEYNSIDSIDSQNVIRWGLRNRLQTKRRGEVEDLVDWQVYLDWRLRPRADQETFADLYSDMSLRPRSWMTLDSQIRVDVNTGQPRMLLHTLTLQPSDVWNWTVGHFYLRDDFSPSPTALGQGNDLIMSAIFYRLNENWGARATHYWDFRGGRMQEQFYTVYRDFRSWTAAVTGGVRDDGDARKDYSIVFSLSLKASPKFGLGGDTVRPYTLLGL